MIFFFRPPHDGNAQYKRPPHQSLPHGAGGGHHSPPLTGTRGYPYPQDPSSRCSTSSTSYVTSVSSPHLVHPGGGGAIYASANHMYRDSHFQVRKTLVMNRTSVGNLFTIEIKRQKKKFFRNGCIEIRFTKISWIFYFRCNCVGEKNYNGTKLRYMYILKLKFLLFPRVWIEMKYDVIKDL